ncbi:MAG: alpha hydrolase [Methanocellales archaeon]|nr:alpha hydrolase [Methanocellales archaeon]MDD3421667.1 alpha hydrolase [Methanocellales archaeon]MDD4898628.1 alpha hydrolase [Methanocellales archaeon]MDD5447294.1 alpha hydrolase [Methanocellales archaeon]
MKVSVLFSGGKDSSIAAIMLGQFFEVELVTCNFGILPACHLVRSIANELGFPHRFVQLEPEILQDAMRLVVTDGFPNNGIKLIHCHALEHVAISSDVQAIADGTRRDDRVPVLSLSEVLSLESRLNVHYIRPLEGYGRKTINVLVDRYFEIEEKESALMKGAEYEFELREEIKRRYGDTEVQRIFPRHHTHSRVIKTRAEFFESPEFKRAKVRT